ncbi:MAG: AarF/ABC1/UbiB kinase family protein [Cyanobacteriota bacterium]|nr:AarF/ABC1/UbiB kinase family protein [Cyanobacteriota bacterium]
MNSQTLTQNNRKYDARQIARFYRLRPWLGWARTSTIVLNFIWFILGLKWDDLRGVAERNKLKRAVQLRKILVRLGPAFIKVGQALSTRPDLIRKDFLEELVKLQDQLPPFDNAIALRQIQSELGYPIKEIFSELSPAPVAAASLGQVYRGRLLTGEEVAVKVQRPNLRPILSLDLYLMRWAAGWLAPWLPLNLGHDLTLIVDEFGTKLFEEIDYLNEGRNAERFATNFRDNPDVKVPAIYWRYTSTRVLTLEWLNGFKLTDTESIIAAGLDPQEIIQIAVTTGLQQLLEYGFFHADPHPGNLFAMPDGKMGYIDFGMMDQLSETTKETLVDAVVHLINKDYTDLAGDYVRLGFLTPDTDIRPIVPALEALLGDAINRNVGDFNFKTITDEFSKLMYEFPFRVPAKFALIIRSLVTQEGIALSLNSDFKIVEVAYPYVARRLLTGESAQLRRRLINVLFKDGTFQWERLENMIAIARTDNNFDLLPTAQMGLQFLLSDEGKFLQQQLIIALTEDDRLHAEEVQRLWNLVKDDLNPSRLLGAAFGALSQLSRERVAAILPPFSTSGSVNN